MEIAQCEVGECMPTENEDTKGIDTSFREEKRRETFCPYTFLVKNICAHLYSNLEGSPCSEHKHCKKDLYVSIFLFSPFSKHKTISLSPLSIYALPLPLHLSISL